MTPPGRGTRVACLMFFCVVLAACQDETSRTDDEGVQLELPTSNWGPGQDAMQAGIDGVLVVDAQDCLVVETNYEAQSARSYAVVWPADFTARRVPGEPVELLDGAGQVVASEGDHIFAGGGFLNSEDVEFAGREDCVPTRSEVFVLQDEVGVGTPPWG